MPRAILATLLIILGVVCRVAPHPWNFAPVGAIALFGGATFASRRAAILVPLIAMFLGDLVVGLHSLMPVIYATYALIAILGMALRERRNSPLFIAGAATLSAVVFFVVTNFADWLAFYPRTWAGLVTCYLNAIPFFDRTLVSDLLFSAILFGVYAVAEKRLPATERAR
jgi:hypothetical protein